MRKNGKNAGKNGENRSFIYMLRKTLFSTKKRTLRRNGRFLEATKLRVLLRFFDSDSHRDGRADHRVVAHADETHHLDVRRHGAGARELASECMRPMVSVMP